MGQKPGFGTWTLGIIMSTGLLVSLLGTWDVGADEPTVAYAKPQIAETAPQLLEPLKIHVGISNTIVEQLRHNHFVSKPLDDQASSDMFDKYLEMLDPARVYFLDADVKDMEKYRYKLDNALKTGDLTAAFDIFNRYQERLQDRLNFAINLFSGDLEQLDFTLDEYLELDREHSPWPKSAADQDDLWKRRLKASVLNMKLNDKPIGEIQELLTKRYKNRLKQTSQTKSEDAFQLYMNAFASTYDPHTQYFSPRNSENFNINMSLSLDGIGAVLSTDDEYTSVVRLVPAGPADKSGQIKPSDQIISVGHGEDGPLIDVVGWRLDEVVELIRGPKGSIVRLEIVAKDSEDRASKVIQITRDTVELEEQSAQKKLITLNRGGNEYRIGVVEIPTFYVDFQAQQRGQRDFKSTTRDVRKLIEELKEEDIDGLVIDLRNNGGGSLQEADKLTGLFIKSGPTVQVKSARRGKDVHADIDDMVTWDGPMAVVVNRLSASASEIFAGAIKDYERGLIVGSQTFGKGTVQTLVPLNRGQLKITAFKFYRVSGESTQHKGVLPDVEFPELYDTDAIGESSLDGALNWDQIDPAVYKVSHAIQPLVTELQNKHKSRVADDPDFQYLNDIADRSREMRLKTHLSLNEKKRIEEKTVDDAWRLALENRLRISQGKPPVANLDELEELNDAIAEAKADSEEAEEDEDAMLRESGNILLDFIGMTRQLAIAEGLIDEKLALNQLDTKTETPAL